MGAHVQSQGDGRREGERRALDVAGCAEEGQDRSVVVRIHVDVHEPDARGSPDRLCQALHHAAVLALADVRDALEDLIRHRPVS